MNKASELNNISAVIELKDGRTLYSTNNGFRYWVESKSGVLDSITEAQYNKAKQHRLTKRNR